MVENVTHPDVNDPSVVLFFLALALGGGLTGVAVHWLLGGCATPPRDAEPTR